MVKSPEKLDEFKNRVKFSKGNIFNSDDIKKTVTGTDAVLSTVGPLQINPGEPEKYKMAMENLVTI